MNTLKGCIKFAYDDNRFSAEEYFEKDLHMLFMTSPLNEQGVSYKKDDSKGPGKQIINEPEEGWTDGRYYGEYYIRIEGSDLEPSEMKSAIEEELNEEMDNLHSVFIYN